MSLLKYARYWSAVPQAYFSSFHRTRPILTYTEVASGHMNVSANRIYAQNIEVKNYSFRKSLNAYIYRKTSWKVGSE